MAKGLEESIVTVGGGERDDTEELALDVDMLLLLLGVKLELLVGVALDLAAGTEVALAELMLLEGSWGAAVALLPLAGTVAVLPLLDPAPTELFEEGQAGIGDNIPLDTADGIVEVAVMYSAVAFGAAAKLPV